MLIGLWVAFSNHIIRPSYHTWYQSTPKIISVIKEYYPSYYREYELKLKSIESHDNYKDKKIIAYQASLINPVFLKSLMRSSGDTLKEHLESQLVFFKKIYEINPSLIYYFDIADVDKVYAELENLNKNERAIINNAGLGLTLAKAEIIEFAAINKEVIEDYLNDLNALNDFLKKINSKKGLDIIQPIYAPDSTYTTVDKSKLIIYLYKEIYKEQEDKIESIMRAIGYLANTQM